MTVRIYYGIDGGAPILSGSVGALTNILTACLVDGYGDKEGSGWTLAYSDSNRAAYRQGKQTNNKVLYVNDNLSSTPNVAYFRGYSDMSDLNTGTNAFPSSGQSSTGVRVYKSTISNNEMRNWTLLASESSFYLQINATNTFNSANSIIYGFGDYDSLKVDDMNNCFLIGPASEATQGTDQFGLSSDIGDVLSSGHFLERSFSLLGGSVLCGKHWDTSKDGCTFPNPVDGSIIMSPIWLTEPDSLRGRLKGIYKVAHSSQSFSHGDTFSGSGEYSGKLFQIMRVQNDKCFAFEVSDTW